MARKKCMVAGVLTMEILPKRRRMQFSWISIGEYSGIWWNVIMEISLKCRGMMFLWISVEGAESWRGHNEDCRPWATYACHPIFAKREYRMQGASHRAWIEFQMTMANRSCFPLIITTPLLKPCIPHFLFVIPGLTRNPFLRNKAPESSSGWQRGPIRSLITFRMTMCFA